MQAGAAEGAPMCRQGYPARSATAHSPPVSPVSQLLPCVLHALRRQPDKQICSKMKSVRREGRPCQAKGATI